MIVVLGGVLLVGEPTGVGLTTSVSWAGHQWWVFLGCCRWWGFRSSKTRWSSGFWGGVVVGVGVSRGSSWWRRDMRVCIQNKVGLGCGLRGWGARFETGGG